MALDPAHDVFQYNCRTWTSASGLPANGVSAVAQTGDGYLWLATQSGLIRFDGLEFKYVYPSNFPGLDTTAIHGLGASQTSPSGLWVSFDDWDQLAFCDGQSIRPSELDLQGASHKFLLTTKQTSDGALWATWSDGLARWTKPDLGEKPSFVDSNAVYLGTIQEGRNGRVWLGSAERGLYYWEGGSVLPFPDDWFVKEKAVIHALLEDRRGRIWVGIGSGLRCYDAHFHLLDSISIEPDYDVQCLLEDRAGTVWIGTSTGGLFCYRDGKMSQLAKGNGLADDFVRALMEDREGSLWVATRGGLTQISDVKLPIFSSAEGLLAGSCRGVCAVAEGGIWAAVGRGISWFDGVNATNFGVRNGMSMNYVKRVFQARNGEVYLISGSRAIEIFSTGKVVARLGCETWPVALAEDGQSVLASVAGDLFRCREHKLVPYEFLPGQKPEFFWILNLWPARDGALWVASDNGLFRVKDGSAQHWCRTNGLSGDSVQWVVEDPAGVIWAGLKTGLARVQNGSAVSIRMDDGLFDNHIVSIVPDDFGWLWLNSPRGIFRVSRQTLNDFADGKLKRIACEHFDGLQDVKTIDQIDQEMSACKSADGRIWFPSPQGVIQVDPRRIPSNTVPPLAHIQSVRLDGREVPLDGPGPTSLAEARELEFVYSALSFIAPQKIRFRYRLEGQDPAWVEAGSRRSVAYSGLKPGDYTFQVQACNADGVWSTNGARFEFHYPPRFYQTAWFYGVCALGGLGGVLGLNRWQLRRLDVKQRRLQEANERLEAKVRERTSSLATANASLQEEIRRREQAQADVERIHKDMLQTSRQAGMAEVATSILHNVGNVLNSVNVSCTSVLDRLRQSRLPYLTKAANLFGEHKSDLPQFLTSDDRGQQLPDYLGKLAAHLGDEQSEILKEVESLSANVEHIKGIVAMQQNYARVAGVVEKVALKDLIEDSLKMQAGAYQRHLIHVERHYDDDVPQASVDKHKAMQILVNLFANAKCACDEAGHAEKKVVVRLRRSGTDRVKIEVADNGVGIALENMTSIFSFGFTTRKGGHGFGLHSGALAAREMGGSLHVKSEGPGRGATFTLELPLQSPQPSKPQVNGADHH